MAKAKDFSDDLAVIDTAVKGEVDTILKLVREKKKKEAQSDEPLPADMLLETPSTKEEQGVSQEPERPDTSPKKVRRNTSRLTSSPGLHEQVVLENVTTRLRRETNDLLTEAALRQKLKKDNPSTRQDIIEVALQDWFRKHAYRRQAPADE